MGSQYHLLTPFQRKLLLKQIETELRPEYQRRIQIMLAADSGFSQSQICEMLGCSQRTAQFWMNMARTGNAHLWNDCPIGRPQTVNEDYLDRLRELVHCSPRDCGYSFRRWTAQALSQHLAKEFEIQVSTRHINRLLKTMGLSTRTTPEPGPSQTDPLQGQRIAISDLQPATPDWQPLVNPSKINVI